MGKPGVLLYFGDMAIVDQMSNEEAGIFFRAILEYAQFGTVPQFESHTLNLAWVLIQQKLDKDNEAYLHKIETSAYAAYCREEKRAGRDPVDRAAWTLSRTSCDIEGYQEISPDIGRHRPISNNNSNYNYNSKSNTKSNYKINSKYRESINAPAPTREEVKAFVAEKAYSFDADRFFDYYNAVGWKKNGDAIEDWRSLAANWEKTENKCGSRRKDDCFMHDGDPLSPMMLQAIRDIMESEEGEQDEDNDTV